ncbi:CTP synthetase [Mycoplasmopsis canis PG 14]|uniref:CTP synthase (glutamine hydrolyzing) n=1 Tax=Mycoplasmopsis canis TaxID=29555 RepID=A0A449ARL8_9BACT|nr:CTP synthase [Mycoplasmopsis canis]AMD81182.1 CTP synthetase [Mycoplasmopsis canis PG 14]EIE39753.1 CTP synthetase [Mycoplasmopsis canis PG 14]VEU69006.1 CTP synthetase [Mycoplasmopsis canis]
MKKQTKFIIQTGGVLSGLGKGVTLASIGNLLKMQGFSVFVMKLDPYLNIDPGVMSPVEHGEVYVTSDGGETDLDLGHYERFIDVKLTKKSNYTTGKILTHVFEKERRGEYNGKTVQIVPHVVDEIIEIIESIEKEQQPDFMLIEIGGTVGDIESNPYIYAISKFKSMRKNDVLLSHLAFVPYLSASNEYKSKPSQVSIATLRSYGLNPDILLLRSQGKVYNRIVDKIAEASFLESSNVINIPDKANIYEIPLFLKEQNILQVIFKHFNIKKKIKENVYKKWIEFVHKYLKDNNKKIKLLLVGKYVELEDAYLSIITSLKIAAAHNNVELEYKLINADFINQDNIKKTLTEYDGVLILPGFGVRGFEAKVEVAKFTREHKIPTLGICLGFQAMTVAHARLRGIIDATSKEFNDENKKQTFVLTPFFENGDKDVLGGTLRLGEYPIIAKNKTLAHQIYGNEIFYERHRHRYEVNPIYRNTLEDENFSFSGVHPETGVAEICEVSDHPFYLGVQYHPEFTTRVLKSNPLFDSFITAVKKNLK